MRDDHNNRWMKIKRIWDIIGQLRGESGCPWDRQQTPESVQTYLVEEAHEASASVRAGRVEETLDELGDVLFMIFFLIHLYEENGDFRIEDVCDHICEKMIRRHPHVFGDATVHSSKEVRLNWEKIKADEKAGKAKTASPVPESLPALMRAYRMLSRLSRQEPSWNDLETQSREFTSKSQNLYERIASGNSVSPEVFGNLLLTLANLARLKHHRPEDCLHKELQRLGSFSSS